MKRLVTPDVAIEAFSDGDWLLHAKHTGYIQLKKAHIDRLVGKALTGRSQGRFDAKPGGWQLLIETVDGPVLRTFNTRREYREAKGGL
jgi:hypothetical protein